MKKSWVKALNRAVFSEFENRSVVIAGVGSNNIGAALTEGFHRLGARVVMIGRDAEPLMDLAKKFSIRRLKNTVAPLAFATDLTEEKARIDVIQRSMQAVGTPAVFISTLGDDERIPLPVLSQENLRRQSLINWEVPMMMGADFLEHMRASGGVICLFSSHHGSDLVDRQMMGYGCSKAALDNAVSRLAHEAAATNTPEAYVRVIGVRPGWVQSQAQIDRFAGAFQDATRNQLIPVEMNPHDLVAPTISLMSKNFGGLISGVTVPLDAGFSNTPVRERVFQLV